ncbi:UNVERIFIED_CONTAM: hypothetical protein GTU68_025730 [Idotea baltica]|nr:hypothetical protein [Idotea baltica]
MRRLDGLLQGDYRSLIRGGGLDFTDLRDYQPQDDIRHIDWNVTARMNTPFVRQFVEDRDLTAWFLLDRSASMAFGGDPNKAQMLTDTVVALARLITKGGNRVGAVLWNNHVQSVIEPRSGRRQVLRLAKHMLAPPEPSDGPTDLARLGHAALASIRRRSLIFVISDFVSEAGWERPLALLARRHEVIALRIVDPAEVDLPNVGVMVMQDAETGEQLLVDTSDRAFRERFAEAASQREHDIDQCARRASMDLHRISTDDDMVRSVVAMAARRKMRRR